MIKKCFGACLCALLLLIVSGAEGICQEADFVNNTGLPALGRGTVRWADFDNDGWPDVVMNGTDASGTKVCAIYRNRHDSTFINLGAGLSPADDGDLAVGDVNRDGWIDVLVSGRDVSNRRITRLYLNQGNGNFAPSTTTLPGISLGQTTIADINNDGRPDLLLSGLTDRDQPEAFVYLQQPDGSFRTAPAAFTPVHSGSWAVADLNNDAYVDLLLSGTDRDNQPTTQLWLNRFGQRFERVDIDLPPLYAPSLSVAHLDHDGWYDLFLAGRGSDGQDTAVIYTNTQRDNFRYLDSAAAVTFAASALLDLDQDGHRDLLYTGANQPGYYYRYQSDTDFTQVSYTLPSLFSGSMTGADINQDLATDYLLAGYRATNTPVSLLFVNQNLVPNAAPTPPGRLEATTWKDSVVLSWDAGTDAETSFSALTYALRIGTQPDTADIVHPGSFLSSGKRKMMQTVGYAGRQAIVRTLPEGTYYWSVQAIDASGIASPFAPIQSFTVCYPVRLGEDQAVCEGEPITLTAGSPADVVNWSSLTDGTLASDQRTLTHTVTYTDTLVAEAIKPTGCTQYDTLIVTALPLPQDFPPRDLYACPGDSVTLMAGSAQDTVNWWAQPDSLLAADQSAYVQRVVREDSILVEVINTRGCRQAQWVYLHPIAQPEVNLSADTTVCAGSVLEIVLDQTYDSLHWYSTTVGRLPMATDTLRHRMTQPDTLWVAAFRNTVCARFDTIAVQLRALPPAQAGPDTVVCRGGSVPVGQPMLDTTGLQFRWSPTSALDDATSPHPLASPTQDQTYILTVTDTFGCQNYDTMTVYLDSATVVDPGEDRYVCRGSSTVLGAEPTARGSQLAYRYQWTPATGLDDPTSANPVASPLETTTYQLVVFTAGCPVDTAQVTVEVKPLPIINIQEDTVAAGYGEPVSLHAEGGDTYLWYPSQNFDNYQIANPRVRPEQTTTYYAVGTDSLGCQNTDSVVVIVRNDLFIPTLFTPNGDGRNDTFRVYGYGIDELTLSIFNLQGELLFRTRRSEEALGSGWDGTSQGQPQPTGVYTWSIQGKFHDQRPLLFQGQRSGTFKLIR